MRVKKIKSPSPLSPPAGGGAIMNNKDSKFGDMNKNSLEFCSCFHIF